MVKSVSTLVLWAIVTSIASYQRITYGVAENWVLFAFIALFPFSMFALSHITEWYKKTSY
jgi:hypothetical protein